RVVRGDDAIEPPFLAEYRRQQLPRGMTRDPVDVAVRRHHAGDPGTADHGFEWQQLLVAQLAWSHVGRRLVQATLGEPVTHEMLRGGSHALLQVTALEATHVRGTEDRGHVRIFAIGLLD